MPIPVENIYYLLCYAWNKLDERDRVSIAIDDKTELIDLFAKVLVNASRVLLKRGIDRSYVDCTRELAGIRGKLNLSETLKSGLHLNQRTICSFDEFSANIVTNQILVTTMRRLLKTNGLDAGIKDELKRLLWMFAGIESIELGPVIFKSIRLNRNNAFYGFVLNVCQIIYESVFPAEDKGEYQFVDFTKDENKMNRLFEAFVRNFYRLEQNKFSKVGGENIEWNFDDLDDRSKPYLPLMKTDITLESDDRKIIIDAKYYQETMSVNFDKEKIKSANLYQLFSYLLNQENEDVKTREATGILLYPTIDRDYDLFFKYDKHPILIRTINLNTNWRNIADRLLEIIG